MASGIRTALKDDRGFTLVEIVFAAFILFFAMTALIGLMGATTNMGASAKSRAVLTNVLTGEMDRIRALPFDQVGVGTVSGGLLPASQTFSKFGFTVTLSYVVTDRTAQNGTKEVLVSGVATRAGFPTVSSSTFSAVRNRVGGKTNYSASNAPLIEFTSNTTESESILVGKTTAAGNAIVIGARATSADANIARIEFRVDGLTGTRSLRDGNTIYAAKASYDVPTPTADVTWSFAWDTRQVDDAGAVSLADGRRAVTIIAYDDKSRPSASRARTFIVDNYPPDVPGGHTLATSAKADFSQTVAVAWDDALDGTDPASGYECEVYDNTNGSTAFTSWTRLGVYSARPTITANPFSMYMSRVLALSPRGNPGLWGDAPAVVVTRPRLTGTHDVLRTKASSSKDNWKYTSGLSIEKPRFPYTAVKVEMERTGGGAANAVTDITALVNEKWNVGQVYAYSDVATQNISKNSSPTPPEYRLKVTLTPTGFGGGASRIMYSQYMKGSIPSISNTSPAATNLAYEQRW